MANGHHQQSDALDLGLRGVIGTVIAGLMLWIGSEVASSRAEQARIAQALATATQLADERENRMREELRLVLQPIELRLEALEKVLREKSRP